MNAPKNLSDSYVVPLEYKADVPSNYRHKSKVDGWLGLRRLSVVRIAKTDDVADNSVVHLNANFSTGL